MKDKVIVALDVDSLDKAKQLVKTLSPVVNRFKVGKELFTAVGPDAVKMIHDHGSKVFLDLKFHDIPNTVVKAVRSATQLGVWMCNVHCLGGREMMTEAAKAKASQSVVIGVTVLTSMNQEMLKEVGVAESLENEVVKLALLAKASGLNGVVASGLEAPKIRAACGKDFLIVTPGVRPEGADKGDQKRVLTPQLAIEAGADYLVIGRPITEAVDPRRAAESIVVK